MGRKRKNDFGTKRDKRFLANIFEHEEPTSKKKLIVTEEEDIGKSILVGEHKCIYISTVK